jgi:N-hydroxyarylamine O-acetyltransferase
MKGTASSEMEVRRYLDRIDAELPEGPTLEGLRDLHLAHLRAVPFENLDVYRGVPIVLDRDRILKKVAADRRGGFCYELNTAFHWLLEQLGYQVAFLSAEVARPQGGFGIPFDHMTLLARIDGDAWLADVGFGDSFLRPLPFIEGEVHEEEEYRYRLTRHAPYWHLERAPRDEEGYRVQYRFTTVPRQLADYRVGCEYHQTSPESTFTQRVVATRALEDGRVTLTRDRVILRQGGARSETPLPDEAAFYSALARHFGIRMETA